MRQEEVSGPRLLFAKDEFLPTEDLRKLRLSLPTNERQFFANQPLVFLNGCETGTAGFYATTNSDFPGTFLVLGSRGVIATEAPVWAYFGYHFADKFLRRLILGDPVPLLLLETRTLFLKDSHNPLGLLYSYYGGADVRLGTS